MVSNFLKEIKIATIINKTIGNHLKMSFFFDAQIAPKPSPKNEEIKTILEKYASDITLDGSHRIKTNSKKSARKLIKTRDMPLSSLRFMRF